MKDVEKKELEQSQLKGEDLEQVVGGSEESINLEIESNVISEGSKAGKQNCSPFN